MTAPPLTHHDILALVGPFSRRGLHVDLANSARHERKLRFRAEAASTGESLELECLETGSYRLVRTHACAEGLEAEVRSQGRDLDRIIDAVTGVPAERLCVTGPGFVIARSYVARVDKPGALPTITLSRGRIVVAGLTLTMRVAEVRRMAADLAIEPTGPEELALPQDILAVLGWNWARLVPATRGGWTSKLRLRGDFAARTRAAEAALELVAPHLVRTLAEPPSLYHDRLRAARWGVFWRRGIPTFTALSLFALVFLFAHFREEVSMAVWVALYHVPTVIMAVAFLMQELPTFEIPPIPRRPDGPDWRARPQAAAVVGTGKPLA